MQGFVAPRDPSGGATLYGPPPWRFAGRSITVFAACDPAGIAALIPGPLESCGDPVLRFSVHELTCELGFGWEWALANPARSRLREAVVGVPVRCGARLGFWDPFLWTDSDAELAVGREFYGWPQRSGTIALTVPHPLTGWADGDIAAGHVSRFGEPAFRLRIDIQTPGAADVPSPPFEGFFLERVLPNPVDGTRLREVLFARMQDVKVGDFWSGPAALSLDAPELAPLGTPRPLAGQVNAVAWTKNLAELLHREVLR